MSRLLIVSNDKLGRRAAARLAGVPGLTIATDVTPGGGRILRLVRRGSLSPLLLVRMAIAEALRRDTPAAIRRGVRSNRELRDLVARDAVEAVYLFRAGLIIDQESLNSGARFYNCHCARLDGYGGLGAIRRALRAGAYDQCATLHRVTERIDSGEVIALEPYQLDPGKNYGSNEDIAYDAGIRLLSRVLPPA